VTGAELRAWRTSRGLYQRDVVRILTEAGMAMDQPTVSEYERGLAEVPAEAAAALAAVSADYPVTGEPTPAPPPRKPKRQRREAVRAQIADEDDDDGQDDEPAPAARDDDESDEPQPDRAPRPVQPAGRREQAARGVAWSAEVRNQLERDPRVLFAGDTFLVPVPVQLPDGSIVEHAEEAAIPGLAQIVGFADPFDGRVIEMNAPQMARAWAELADESPTVRRWLILLTYGGAWRGVIAATLPVVYSIAVHHGLIPPVLGGAGAAPQRVEAPQPVDGVAVS